MNEKDRRKKAIEALIKKCLDKGYLGQAITASSLREEHCLKESEKCLVAKKRMLNSWQSWNANEVAIKQMLEKAEYENIDELLNFAMNNIRNVGYETTIGILAAFGTNNPEIVLRLVILIKEHNRGMLFWALKAVRSDGAPQKAVEFVVKWALEDGATDHAIKASKLREEPGLTQLEIETLLEKHKKSSDVVTSIILADMREKPGLTTKDIEDLAAATT